MKLELKIDKNWMGHPQALVVKVTDSNGETAEAEVLLTDLGIAIQDALNR